MNGITIKEAAEKLNLTSGHLSNLLCGRRPMLKDLDKKLKIIMQKGILDEWHDL